VRLVRTPPDNAARGCHCAARIAVGDPDEIVPPHELIWAIQKSLDFPRYVFGVERPPQEQSIMPQVMPRYAKALQNHRDDRIVPQ